MTGDTCFSATHGLVKLKSADALEITVNAGKGSWFEPVTNLDLSPYNN